MSNNKNKTRKTPATKIEEPIVEAEVKDETVVEDIPEQEPKEITSLKGKVANCAKVRLRTAPTTDSNVIEILPRGTEVTIDPTFSKNDWFLVTVGTMQGYIMNEYLEVE